MAGLSLGRIVIGAGLLMVAGAQFQLLFVASNLGKVAAALTGGWLAQTRAVPGAVAGGR